MTTNILLASDGSKHVLRATEEAIKLAQLNETEIIIAYVQKSAGESGTEAVSPDINNQMLETTKFLVIGSQGLNRMQEMVMGSVSYYVMKHAQCPVLVVK